MIYALDPNYFENLRNIAKEVEIYKKTNKHEAYEFEITNDYAIALSSFVPIKRSLLIYTYY